MPKIINSTESQQLVYVMGNEGAGKSSFVNYMLGHEFTLEYGFELTGVKDESLPHANIHTSPGDMAEKATTYQSGEFAFCDCPGSGTLVFEPEMQIGDAALKLAQEYKLGNAIKGFIVVISNDELRSYLTNHTKLCADLQSIIDIANVGSNI